MAMQRPICQFKGAPPHPAKPAYMLVWTLPSGDVTRFSCAAHRFSFGGSVGYWVNKVECFEDNMGKSFQADKTVALPNATLASQPDSEGKPSPRPTCVDPECGNPAPYTGAWCDSCQSRWEDEQRAKAKTERRSISVKRGF